MRTLKWQGPRMSTAVYPELAQRGASLPSATSTDVEPGGHTILQRAESEAQALMEAARGQAAALMEEARREGILEGRAEALAEARVGLQELTRGMTAARDQLEALEASCRSQAGELIVNLALTLAERILQAEVARDPAALLRVVQAALAVLPSPDEIVIRVHPEGAALLQAHRETLLAWLPESSSVRVLGDPTVPAGGCLLETPCSLVDATFPTQLAEARRRLQGEPW
jgi:flagellar assembly protein FliH